MVPGFALKNQTPLVGMDIRKHFVKERLVSVDLIMMYQNGAVVTCEISRKEQKQHLESVESLLV